MLLAHGTFPCPLEILAAVPVLGVLWTCRHALIARWLP